ncbi:hypothetical protein P692DRAFT_20823692 [Suillus brevipes Sb2]|nr:hypothetical protein P692DRAFT_20823692 [Suillus brevipes Sb2]
MGDELENYLHLFSGASYSYADGMETAPTGSLTFSLPHSTGRSTSLSEFTTMVAIDANSYQYQSETLKSIEARLADLTAEVSGHRTSTDARIEDIQAKLSANMNSLDATYTLAQEGMDCNSGTRILVQELKLDIAAVRVVLMEIRDKFKA